jgi:hypothetical protein
MSALVGVLLPVRLETAFDPHAGGCRLRVIVIPDAAWIDRHDDAPRGGELDALEAAWRAANGDFTTQNGAAAFDRFADAYGAGRAAWLARQFPPVAGPGGLTITRPPAGEQKPPRGNVIRALPPAIELWISRVVPPGSSPALVRIATLTPTAKALRIELDDAVVELDPAEELFRPSWDAATAAGLTADLELAAFGLAPGDIAVLFAVGIGDAEPDALFAAHRDGGQLAILPVGAPTNAVAGAPAAELGRTTRDWRDTVRPPDGGHEEGTLSRLLTGRDDAVGPIPAPRRGPVNERSEPPRAVHTMHERGAALMAALWPALWGASLKDLWGIDASDPEVVLRLGLWSGRFVHPEGTVPPIRIGNQPYGVLPVTSLARWDAVGDPFGIEGAIARYLPEARAEWARRAEAAGTIAGADAQRVLALLERTPVTTTLTKTPNLPLEAAQLGLIGAAGLAAVVQWWRKQAELPRQLRHGEARRGFVQFFGQQDLTLPLVEPPKPGPNDPWRTVAGRTLFEQALRWFIGEFGDAVNMQYVELTRAGQPRSLLFRLIAHAAIVAASEVVRTGKGLTGPVQPFEGRLFERWGNGASLGDAPGSLAARVFRALWKALDVLASEDTRVLERSLLAALDTASHRIDPWVAGLAWRRLTTAPYVNAPRAVGAYGWVDRPFHGVRGPTNAGLLLAPSAAQARAAVILRDKAIHDSAPAAGALPGTTRWDMNLDSRRVRMAQRLAAEVRIGAHLGEALGREVERVLATRTAVDAVRREYPLHSSHAGRRVCDGEAVLKDTPAQVTARTGVALTANQETRLSELRAAIDAYGDLLVADAVFDVVSGHAETANAAMEAAAGLELPPELDVIRTPRSGRALSTLLMTALPAQTGPAVVTGESPARIAEPSLAAHVTATFPPAVSWLWTREDVGTAVPTTVTLAALGLEPVDLLVLEPEQVAGLVVAHTATAPAKHPRISPQGSGPQLHARLRRLAATFTGELAVPSRLRLDAVARANDGAALDAADDDVAADLWERFERLRDEAIRLRDAAEAAAAAVATETDGDPILAALRRWAILPIPSPEAGADALARRADVLGQAAQLLNDRLARVAGAAGTDTADRLALLLSTLASPAGRVPVLARLPRAMIATIGDPLAAAPLTREPIAPRIPRPRIDGAWLDAIAAVRPTAARIEAYQLEAASRKWPRFDAWTNWPGDPWQQHVPPPAALGQPAPALAVIYAPPTVDLRLQPPGDAEVAVSLVDAWTETVPSQAHTATAAFGFNAPAARAPQAILVAVTPVDGLELDVPTLLDMLIETRELAHARMAGPRELRALGAALPLTLMPSLFSTKAGLELDDWER